MTKGQILQEAANRRNNRRIFGEAQADEQRKRFIHERPALQEAWNACVSENIRAVRAANHGTPAVSREARDAFNRAFAAALAEEGLSADAFTYKPLCPLCGDTGMTGGTVQRYCSCVLNEIAGQVRDLTGIRSDFSFEAFDLSLFPDTPLPERTFSQREQMSRIRTVCLNYTETCFSESPQALLLVGGTGLGKTYLLHCIGNQLTEKGRFVVLTAAYQLVRASLSREEEGDPLAIYQDADLLMIDDLGSEPLYQKITVETLFALINDRMARGLPTVISTNLSPTELHDRYGERLASRLLDRSSTRVLRLEGTDIRMIKG